MLAIFASINSEIGISRLGRETLINEHLMITQVAATASAALTVKA